MYDVIGMWAQEMAGDMVAELGFYEWAFGRLADHDIGALGEFVVGTFVGGNSEGSSRDRDFDLATYSGATCTVRTCAMQPSGSSGMATSCKWRIAGPNTLATHSARRPDWWIFLAVPWSGEEDGSYDMLRVRTWSAYVVPGKTVARLVKAHGDCLDEAVLRRTGHVPQALEELDRSIQGREFDWPPDEDEFLVFIICAGFYRRVHGNVFSPANADRFAAYQVMRHLCDRPFPPYQARTATEVHTRHGHHVVACFSDTWLPTADGTSKELTFQLPPRARKRDQGPDFYVLCSLGMCEDVYASIPQWYYQWVPASVLASFGGTVTSSELEARGYPRLTARKLRHREAKA